VAVLARLMPGFRKYRESEAHELAPRGPGPRPAVAALGDPTSLDPAANRLLEPQPEARPGS
ncbi:MAG TPA: hypothetical protein VMD59_16380, partial [Acidimicrobiales bacterium]|nr:hypothetical protein [Acidimicrobiales bacterium]